MRIAIGSTREPQVEAVQQAWQVFGKHLVQHSDETVDFVGYDIAQPAEPQPLSARELTAAAEARVEELILQLKKEKTEADFYVGLEEGFNLIDGPGSRRQVFYESWVFVSDGHQGYFGHGGGLPLPRRVAGAVIDRGIELGIVVDRFSHETQLRSADGLWGIFTRDYLSRKHSFMVGLLAAFAPFYNPVAYR